MEKSESTTTLVWKSTLTDQEKQKLRDHQLYPEVLRLVEFYKKEILEQAKNKIVRYRENGER